jgi:hypothetical protein
MQNMQGTEGEKIMECPWCKAEFVPHSEMVYRNVDTYGGPSAIKAKCCGNIVYVGRIISYSLAQTGRTDDDWGNKATPKKVEHEDTA